MIVIRITSLTLETNEILAFLESVDITLESDAFFLSRRRFFLPEKASSLQKREEHLSLVLIAKTVEIIYMI